MPKVRAGRWKCAEPLGVQRRSEVPAPRYIDWLGTELMRVNDELVYHCQLVGHDCRSGD